MFIKTKLTQKITSSYNWFTMVIIWRESFAIIISITLVVTNIVLVKSLSQMMNTCSQYKTQTADPDCGPGIADFHCHTIIKTIQQISQESKETREDECSNSLPKVQVCAMFQAEDIRKNVLCLKARKHLCEYLFSYEDCLSHFFNLQCM